MTTAAAANQRTDPAKPMALTQRVKRVQKTAGRPRPDGEARDDGWDQKLPSHRQRQVCVSAILESTFGEPAKCNPDLWERRAYLMLVGLVYERLATNEEEIPTDELVALAKVLAENRRVEARLRGNPPAEEAVQETTPSTGELPEQFADTVRQVYGTNFQTPDARTLGGN